ncbi:unnamed protein product [Jaminaea pallidilutea]
MALPRRPVGPAYTDNNYMGSSILPGGDPHGQYSGVQPVYPEYAPDATPLYNGFEDYSAQQQAAAAAAYWQLPPAPRLTAAAARGWEGSMQPHPMYAGQAASYAAPWMSSSMQPPFNAHPQRYPMSHDPRLHQYYESGQREMHEWEHLRRQSLGHGPIAFHGHGYPPSAAADPAQNPHLGHQMHSMHPVSSAPPTAWGGYAEPYPAQRPSVADRTNAAFAPAGHAAYPGLMQNAQNMHHTQSQPGVMGYPADVNHTFRMPQYDWNQVRGQSQQVPQQRHRYSQSDLGGNQGVYQQQAQQMQQLPQHHQHHLQHHQHHQPMSLAQHPSARDHAGQTGRSTSSAERAWRLEYERERQRGRRSQSHMRPRSSDADVSMINTGTEGLQQPIRLKEDDAAAAQENPAGQNEGHQHDANAGPAPPSPGTLDKSGVPLSSFGAELIWFACAALSEPDLLIEAHSGDATADTMSPSSGSVPSSPSVATPLMSPRLPCKDADLSLAMLSSNGGLDERLLKMGYRKAEHERTAKMPHAEMKQTRFSNSSSSSTDSSGPGTPSPDGTARNATTATALSRHFDGVSDATQRHSSPMRLSPPNDSVRSNAADSSHVRRGGNGLGGPLCRTKSQERSRGAVLSVLGLVSPHWRWTQAFESLPSLVEATTPVSRSSEMKERRLSASMPSSPRESSNVPLSPIVSINGEVSPAFRRFTHQVLAQTLLSPTAFLLALLYALRVPSLAIDANGNVDQEAVDVFASPPSAAPFKLFTLGMMIANKHLDDNTFLNKTWNEVTGIPLAELNRMEQYYLMRCNYEIAIPNSIWSSFLLRVRRREQGRLATSNFAQAHQQRESAGQRQNRAEVSQKTLLAVEDMLSNIETTSDADALDVLEQSNHGEADDGADGNERLQSASRRPTAALLLNHELCHSAPASAPFLESPSKREDLPQRPRYDAASRSHSHQPDSGGYDLYAPRAHDVPLAPSALLHLLNSGRTLTSAH